MPTLVLQSYTRHYTDDLQVLIRLLLGRLLLQRSQSLHNLLFWRVPLFLPEIHGLCINYPFPPQSLSR